ncbi:MAG: hypothetical protein JXR96_20960 [Deltaproteobacteria bacterium]|nr:hypothetical protein [Deltaproteobacteria bacterium]
MGVEQNICFALERLGFEQRCRRARELAGKAAGLEREIAEIDGQIPLWDRIVFFSDTPDEKRRKKIVAELARLRDKREAIEQGLTADLQRLADEIPPVEIGQRIEYIGRLAARPLRIRGVRAPGGIRVKELESALRDLSERVTEIYLPGFDHRTLERRVAEAVCAEEAARTAEPGSHYHLGVEPVRMRELVAIVAGRLRAGDLPLFALLRETGKQEQRVVDLQRALAASEEKVGLLTRMNPFSDTEVERERDRLADRLAAAAALLDELLAQCLELQEQALELYPPLAIYQAVGQALALLDSMEPGVEAGLTPEGAVVERKLAMPRALLLAAFRGLRGAYGKAYPGAPLLSEIGPAEPGGKLRAQRDALLDAAFAELDQRRGPALLAKCLAHAYALGGVSRQLQGLRSSISVLDRIAVWSDTQEEKEEKWLQGKRHFYLRASRDSWQELLGLARQVAAELPPLRLRDLVIEAGQAMDSLQTDRGSFRSKPDCTIRGKAELLQALEEADRVLRLGFGLRADRQQMMEDVASYLLGEPGPAPEPRMFTLGSYTQAVACVAKRLDRDFAVLHRRIFDAQQRREVAGSEDEGVSRRISVWDRINVFSTTPEEKRHKELLAEIAALDADLRAGMLQLDRLFERALQAYPPAGLFFSLPRVAEAVRELRVECHERKVKKGARSQSRYRCSLNGKKKARQALRDWTAGFVAAFGDLPGCAELLALWAGRDLRPEADGWLDWDPRDRPRADHPWLPP